MSKISPVKMDSRKFLGAINGGEQAKIALFEAKVEELGKSMGNSWKLASLGQSQLFIEDSNSNYFVADYKREKGNRYTILNVKPLQLIEAEKQGLFEKSTLQLVNAIEENDQKSMASAFDRLASQRFSSRAVPTSGVVKTRDGVVRNLRIASDAIISDESRASLEAAIVESITDHVIVENDSIVGIRFNDKRFNLPINEWTVRRAVARSMKNVAENAYRSEGFQNRAVAIAAMIENNKIEEAVGTLNEFFSKQQEFCMLNKSEMQVLAENALAAKGIFNQRLCEDVAAIFYRTNARANKAAIIREWMLTAKKAGNSALVENVDVLSHSKNFEGAYDKFLNAVFTESMSSKDIRRDTYVLALQQLHNMPRIKESPDLAGQIKNLIENLKSPGDDAALVEAENLLANVKSHLSNEGLDDFDQMPGDGANGDEGDDLGLDDTNGADELGDLAADDVGDSQGGKGTTVNFNITIGSEGIDVNGGGGGDDAGLEDIGGGDDLEDTDDEDTGLGGGGDDAGGMDDLGGGGDESEDDFGLGESKIRRKPISEEWEKPWLKKDKKDGKKEDSEKEDDSESDSDMLDELAEDRYAFNSNSNNRVGLDYGIPPISESDCSDVVNLLPENVRTLDENGLRKAIMKAISDNGLVVPRTKIESAIVQVYKMMSESQRKKPIRRKRGFKKTNLTTDELKENKKAPGANDSIVWDKINESKAIGQYRGVRFAVSFKDNLLESESGYAIDMPPSITNNVRAITRRETVDATPVFEFLDASIDQIREFDEVGDPEISEAVAEIANSIDGGLTVRVPPGTKIELTPEEPMGGAPAPGMGGVPAPGMGGDGDMDDGVVSDIAGGMAGDEMGDEADLAGGDGEVVPPEGGEDEMVDVNDLPPTDGADDSDAGSDGEDGVVDFGGDDDELDTAEDEDDDDSSPVPPKSGPPELEEDNDITNPKAAKYNTTKDDHRKPAVAKAPKAPNGKLAGFDKDEAGAANAGGVKMNKVTPRSNGK